MYAHVYGGVSRRLQLLMKGMRKTQRVIGRELHTSLNLSALTIYIYVGGVTQFLICYTAVQVLCSCSVVETQQFPQQFYL